MRVWFGSIIVWLMVACTMQTNEPNEHSAETPPAAQLTAGFGWSRAEVAILKDLWLGSLTSPPADLSNRVADNPQAAALGQQLFFDPRLSANQQVSCTSCHQPQRHFTDDLAQGLGTRTTQRSTMPLVGVAYSPWLTWDGHHDSLWSQALEPLEHPDEHGTTRLHVVHLIYQDSDYHVAYETLFSPLPAEIADFNRFPDSGGPVADANYRAAWERMTLQDQQTATEIFVNVGKTLAAYQRLLLPGPTPFDAYVQALLSGNEAGMEAALSADEVAGLRLFIGRAGCVRCHNGPLFTDFNFHNTGTPPGTEEGPNAGRAIGLALVAANEFNCLSRHSDAAPDDCLLTPEIPSDGEQSPLKFAFKTPSLRNVAETAPYMHIGQFDTLGHVLAHYNKAPTALYGQTELAVLDLSATELSQLEAFLHALSGPPATPPELMDAP